MCTADICALQMCVHCRYMCTAKVCVLQMCVHGKCVCLADVVCCRFVCAANVCVLKYVRATVRKANGNGTGPSSGYFFVTFCIVSDEAILLTNS